RPPLEERRRDRDRDKDRDRDRDKHRPARPGGPPVTTPPATPGPVVAPGPAASRAGDPSRSVLTPAPCGSVGVAGEQINRWDDAIEQASNEFGVPAERMKAHIVVESAGQPDAIQQNAQGWSFGLMQVVPRWWRDVILRLAQRPDTGQDDREIGQLL